MILVLLGGMTPDAGWSAPGSGTARARPALTLADLSAWLVAKRPPLTSEGGVVVHRVIPRVDESHRLGFALLPEGGDDEGGGHAAHPDQDVPVA